MSYYKRVQVAVTEDGTKQIMGKDIHCIFVVYFLLKMNKCLDNLLLAITELTSLNLGMASLLNAPLHSSQQDKVCLKSLGIVALLFYLLLLLNFSVI